MRKVTRICPPISSVVTDPLLKLYYAIKDHSVLSNPWAFIGSKSYGSKPVSIAADVANPTPMLIHKNTGSTPCVVAMQARGSTNALRNYLFVATEEGKCKLLADAAAFDYDIAPKVSVVLAPNEEVWANVTDPDGGTAAQVVNYAVIPLHDTIGDF